MLVRAASAVLGCATWARRHAYEFGLCAASQLEVPVICVGNASAGGTGKTPMVEHLARRVIAAGAFPLVLTRGHSHDEVDQTRAALGAAGAVVVDPNRARGARNWLATHRAQHEVAGRRVVALLDDGLQHFALARTSNLVMVDAAAFEPGAAPRLLRESLSAAARRAALVVVHNAEFQAGADAVQAALARTSARGGAAPRAIHTRAVPLHWVDARTGATVPLDALRHVREVALVAGIGSPGSFVASARALVPALAHVRLFGDHHVFTRAELAAVGGSGPLVTTLKDFHRCPALFATAARGAYALASALVPVDAEADAALALLVERALETVARGGEHVGASERVS